MEPKRSTRNGRSPDAAAAARRASDLRVRADRALADSEDLLAAAARRRARMRGLSDQAMLRLEMVWSRLELRWLDRTSRRDEKRREAERERDDAWMRDEIASMLANGWTREELAEVGIGEELLASLGLAEAPVGDRS